MFPESPLIHDLIESDTDACKRAGKSIRMARNGFFAEENMYLDIVGHDEVGARGKNLTSSTSLITRKANGGVAVNF